MAASRLLETENEEKGKVHKGEAWKEEEEERRRN